MACATNRPGRANPVRRSVVWERTRGPSVGLVGSVGLRLGSLDGGDPKIDAHPNLAVWWRQAEQLWENNKGEKNALSLKDRLDYHGGDRHLYVFGPEAVTIADALRVYCRIAAGGKRVLTAPLPMMRALNRTFMRGAMTRELDLMRVMQRVGEPTNVPEASEVLGPPTTTLEEWCSQRRASEA